MIMKATLRSLCGLMIVLGLAGLASAASVAPTETEGNPNCADLGYQFGFKPQPEPPPAGTYTSGDGYVEITLSDSVMGPRFFDWTSNVGIDAVIVKGGDAANVYVYDPPAESFGDTGLVAPNNASGGPAAVSHIEFCYDYNVAVSKTAETSYTRTFNWSISKLASPSAWHLFEGDSGSSTWTVSVGRTGSTDSGWGVSGEITVVNDTPLDATLTSVADAISGLTGSVTVDCGVSFPYVLAAGDSLTCSYASPLPDGSTRLNTATVNTTGVVQGGSGTADVVFGDPTTLVNDSVDIVDSNGGAWSCSSDVGCSWSYDETFGCDGDQGGHTNIATIAQTGQSATAMVSVACYELDVVKDADTSYTRTWDWTIEKTADVAELVLAVGQSYTINYEVALGAEAIDSDFVVAGDITISNPNLYLDAPLNAVLDVVSPDISGTVSCPTLIVPAGGSIACTYTATLPDATGRTNIATAVLTNMAYAPDGTGVPSGTTSFDSDPVAVTFGDPSTVFDACIELTDTLVDDWGNASNTLQLCTSDLPATFGYGVEVMYDTCGAYLMANTAAFTTTDDGVTGSDTVEIVIDVPCEAGCTLTPGYWKTHSEYGPAPYDETWAQLSEGADTEFFLSGQSYYDVLWTAPQGNAYYILARAWIAAELNGLNGATLPPNDDVGYAFEQGEILLSTYTPDEVAGFKGKDGKDTRALFILNAMILDEYNNGFQGVPHCSEDLSSAN